MQTRITGDTMGRKPDTRFTKVQQIRISEDMEALLDAYCAARMQREPEMKIGRSDAVRILLAKALATELETGELAEYKHKGRR